MLNQWEIGLVRPIQKSIGKYSRFMAQMTWFSPRMVLLGLGQLVASFGGNVPPKKPKGV